MPWRVDFSIFSQNPLSSLSFVGKEAPDANPKNLL
jgi:hypothetical protein